MTKEDKIIYYSYYFSASEGFVEEYYKNFEEMEKILKIISKSLKNNKEYKATLGDASIMIENKKTKESYKLSIEF